MAATHHKPASGPTLAVGHLYLLAIAVGALFVTIVTLNRRYEGWIVIVATMVAAFGIAAAVAIEWALSRRAQKSPDTPETLDAMDESSRVVTLINSHGPTSSAGTGPSS
jgi:hypothetical protein